MGTIKDTINSVLRDFETDGVPASGLHEPRKADIRTLGPVIEAAITAVGTMGLASVKFDTKAHMDADLAHADGTVALVYADAAGANNDLWVKSGASGAGNWVLSGTAGIIHDTISAAAQPYVDEAAASATAAADSATNINANITVGGSGISKIALDGGGAFKSVFYRGTPAGDIAIVDDGGGLKDWAPANLSDLAGSRASANDRISTGLTSYGHLDRVFIRPEYLRRIPGQMRKRLRSAGGVQNAARLTLAVYMDSWGGVSYFSQALGYTDLPSWNGGHKYSTVSGSVDTVLGWAGTGWIGLAVNTPNGSVTPKGPLENFLWTVARAGTWTDVWGTDPYSPDVCSAYTTTVGDTYTISSTSNVNPVTTSLKLLAGGAGTFDYSWDNGVTWSADVVLSGANRQEVALANLPATAAWTLEICNRSATPLILMGLVPEQATNGVKTHLLNAGGSQMRYKAAQDAPAFNANLALLGPDGVFLGTNINDRNNGRTVAQWQADTGTAMSRIRAWSKAVDIIIVMPPEVGGANIVDPPMSQWRGAAEELLDTYSACMINLQPVFGSEAAVGDYSHTAAWPRLDAIDTHAAGDGIYDVQEVLLRLFTKGY